MFDSALTDYDCMSTPAKRDFIRELVEACRRAGVRILFETCMIINRSWGYNACDRNFKSVRQLIHTLVDIVSLELEGPPVVGRVIRQGHDGVVTLSTRDPDIHGRYARYEFGSGKDNIGYWVDPTDFVTWDFVVERGGSFTVQVTYACAKGVGGSEYLVSVAGRQLQGRVCDTGSWTKFITESIGTVKLGAGRYRLTVRPLRIVRGVLMNLKRIVLKPMEPKR